MKSASVLPEVVTSGRRNPLHFGLAKRLRGVREKAGISPSALSMLAGLGRTTVLYIEDRGSIPHLNTVERLAQILKVSPCWVAYGIQAECIEGGDLQCTGIAERLRQVRAAQGVSRKALGKLAGLSTTAISNIEDQGHIPTVATCEAIAKELQVDPCWLAYGQAHAPKLTPQAAPGGGSEH